MIRWNRPHLAIALAAFALASCSDSQELPTEPQAVDLPATTAPSFNAIPDLDPLPDFTVPDPAVVCADGETYALYAGQTEEVGFICVDDDGSQLSVKYYSGSANWCFLETHTDLFEDAGGFTDVPHKNGNPIPGQFEYVDDELGCLYEAGPYTFDVMPGGYYIAAHAVVQEILRFGPYAADEVYGFDQGVRKDGGPIAEARTYPVQALVPDYLGPGNPVTFFSLGFAPVGTMMKRYVSVKFMCPVRNAYGHDLEVWEATNGTYPLEMAKVFASMNGTNWTELGSADNTASTHPSRASSFDLGDFLYVKYVKVVDMTDPAIHNNAADAFDVDGVLALNDCWGRDETAWAGDPMCESDDRNDIGCDFPGRNWATYVHYTVAEPMPVKVAAARFRSFGNTGGGEVYVGIGDVGVGANRVETNYTWVKPGSYAVNFVYDPVAGTLVAEWDDESLTYTISGGTLPPMDSFELAVVQRDVGATVEFNGVFCDGASVGAGNFAGDGTFLVFPFGEDECGDGDLDNGFNIGGTLVIDDPFGTSQEKSKLEILVGRNLD